MAAPLQNSPGGDAVATSHDLHPSTEADVSVVSSPIGSVVAVAGSPVLRSSSLVNFGALLLFAIVVFILYV